MKMMMIYKNFKIKKNKMMMMMKMKKMIVEMRNKKILIKIIIKRKIKINKHNSHHRKIIIAKLKNYLISSKELA
jgi:hypothetical protein